MKSRTLFFFFFSFLLFPLFSTQAQTITFTQNLGFGSRGEDVCQLQILLWGNAVRNSSGTCYFGSRTQQALITYQNDYQHQSIIQCSTQNYGISSGTGYFGDCTRNYINSLSTNFGQSPYGPYSLTQIQEILLAQHYPIPVNELGVGGPYTQSYYAAWQANSLAPLPEIYRFDPVTGAPLPSISYPTVPNPNPPIISPPTTPPSPNPSTLSIIGLPRQNDCNPFINPQNPNNPLNPNGCIADINNPERYNSHLEPVNHLGSPHVSPLGNFVGVGGKASQFGGVGDISSSANQQLRIWTGHTERNLKPDTNYIAFRWDYTKTSTSVLQQSIAKIYKGANETLACPVDWGPNTNTGRSVDVSPNVMAQLGGNGLLNDVYFALMANTDINYCRCKIWTNPPAGCPAQ